MWSVLTSTGRVPISIVTQVILFRELGPSIIGLGGMITTVTLLFDYMTEFGVGAGIIRTRDISREQINDLFLVNFYLSFLMSLALFLGSPYVAGFFHEPQLVTYFKVVSVVPLVRAFSFTSNALLTRRLEFRKLAIATWIPNALGNLTTIALVLIIGGLPALVAGYMLSVLLRTFTLLLLSRWFPRSLRFSFARSRQILNFSIYVHFQKILIYAMKNMDKLFIGHFLGKEAFGYYEAAKRVIAYILENISIPIARVLFPALAEVQNDLGRMKSGYLQAVRFTSLACFPVLAGLILVASDLFVFAFTSAWTPAVPIFRILCLAAFTLTLDSLVNPGLHSLGKSKASFVYVAILTLCYAVSYSVLWQLGLIGVTIGFSVVTALAYPFAQGWISKSLQIAWREYLRVVRSQLIGSGFMMVILYLTRQLCLYFLEPASIALLAILAVVGVTFFVGFIRMVDPDLFKDSIGTLKLVVRKETDGLAGVEGSA